MKISRRWLGEFLADPLPLEELLRLFPALGFDVDAVEKRGPAFSGIVIGEVLEAAKHPNADRLSLCKVTDGQTIFPVVCGAPNVAAGQRVAFARVGASLPGGMTIAKAKIRGEESQGMICSTAELGLGAEAAGILVLAPDAPLGADAASLLAEADEVLEVDVTANRPDCLSVLGLARELSILLGKPLKARAAPALPEDGAVKTRPVEILEPSLCGRYLGREFLGLRNGPSPGWLAARLEALGQKPINALVDITNYVLFETGHPLHVFDAARLQGGRILVRRAKAGEQLKALDGKTYALTPEELVIADEAGPTAIAGIMGGEPTGATEKTTACFLESAHFAPRSIRAASKRLGLRSESSYRFERGADPEAAALAGARAAELILKICRGKAGSAVDAYPGKQAPKPIEISAAQVNAVLGTSTPAEEIGRILAAAAAKLEERSGGWLFHPPSWRQDLALRQDLAEEVARYKGYDAIPDAPAPSRPSALPEPAIVKAAAALRGRLEGLGFYEVCTVDLVAEKALRWDEGLWEGPSVEVENPLSEDQARLRTSLLPGLLQSALHNLGRGASSLRLFELGRTYRLGADGNVSERLLCAGLLLGEHPAHPHWKRKPSPSDFHDAKGVLEDLLGLLGRGGAALEPRSGGTVFHPKACAAYAEGGSLRALAGGLDLRLLSAFDLSRKPAAAFVLDLSALAERPDGADRPLQPVSPFPTVVRDLSLVFEEGLVYAKMMSAVRDLRLAALFRMDLVDVFTGQGVEAGHKSLTFRFTFSLPDRTLTDAEAAEGMGAVLGALQALGGRLRG